MCRNNRFIALIRRVLNWRIVEDVVLFGHDDDAAGVLTRGHLNVLTAVGNAFALRFSERSPVFLFVDADVFKRRTHRHAGNRARAEGMAPPEHLFNVLMRCALIFAGKVQVDIRRFVAVEAKEHFKRNIEPHLEIRRSADRAVFLRHVDSAGVFHAVYFEVAVLAVRANIMRLKRVYLRNARHGRDKRRADRATGTNEVAVRIGLVHEPLRHQVQRGKPVADDRLKLTVETSLHDRRKRVAIELVRALLRHLLQNLACVFNGRRVRTIREGFDLFAAVGNFVRNVNDNPFCRFRAEVRKLFQHLRRRFKVQRRLQRSVLKAVFSKDNFAVDRVLRVQKVNVAGSGNRDAKPFAQRHDFAIDLQNPFVRGFPRAHEKRVVAAWLNFQIVVETRDAFNRFHAFVVQNRLIQFPVRAGGAENQSVSKDGKQAVWNDRMIMKMLNMRKAHDAVEVLQARLRPRQNDDMVRLRALFTAFWTGCVRAHRQRSEPQRAEPLQQMQEHFARGVCVVRGTMMVFEHHVQRFADGIQLVVFQIPHEIARKHQRVGILLIKFYTEPLAVMADEPHVEFRIVRNQAASF